MIINDMRILNRGALWPALALYAIFLLQAVLPGMVLCHKGDGRAEIEFVLEAAECHCDACELCRHREAPGSAAHGEATAPSLGAAHCRHVPLHNEAGMSSSPNPEATSFSVAPAILAAGWAPSPRSSEAPRLSAFLPRGPGASGPPDEGGLLRC